MRLLIVSDLHANAGALESIRETVDAVVVLGDIVDYGPDPRAAIDWRGRSGRARSRAARPWGGRRTGRGRLLQRR
jgi:hypothetical protein